MRQVMTNNSDINDRVRLRWRRDRNGWLLLADRRRVGRVVPDDKPSGMWRSVLPFGQLSDIANLSWAKSVTLDAAAREIDHDRRAANAPTKCPEKRGDFEGPASPVRFQGQAGLLTTPQVERAPA